MTEQTPPDDDQTASDQGESESANPQDQPEAEGRPEVETHDSDAEEMPSPEPAAQTQAQGLPAMVVPPMQVLHVPAQPSLFDGFWPVRDEKASRRSLVAALLAAVFAASTITLDRPGIGWFIGAAAVAAALVVMAGPTAGRLRLPWLLAALALMAMGAIRASDWLFALCVMTACVAGSLAVAGGRSVRALAFGASAVSVAALRALPWALAGLRALRRVGDTTPRIARTVLITVALLVVFGSLLTSADAAFADLLGGLTPDVDANGAAEWVFLFVLVALATLGAAFTLANPATVDTMPATARRRVRLVEWTLPVGVLVALFGAFVAVQLTVLFGGSEYVLTTADLTYAEYARSGFWQLLAVTVLTLVVLGVAARVAPTDTAAERRWLRVLLGALAALTLVIVVSALVRMWTYQETYGFTVLRLLVEVCEIWLGLVYLLVLAAGLRLSARWVPRAVLGTAMALLLGLAVLNPDRLIAERNLARYAEHGKIDPYYLSALSDDAVPVLARLPEPMRSCVLQRHAHRLAVLGDHETVLGWNLARAEARTVLADLRLVDPVECGSGGYR